MLGIEISCELSNFPRRLELHASEDVDPFCGKRKASLLQRVATLFPHRNCHDFLSAVCAKKLGRLAKDIGVERTGKPAFAAKNDRQYILFLATLQQRVL